MIDAKTDMTMVVSAYEHHQYRPMGAPGEVRIHGIFASQYTLPDGSVAGDFQWLADQYKADHNTRRLDALVTLESAQAAVAELHTENQKLRKVLESVATMSEELSISGFARAALGETK